MMSPDQVKALLEPFRPSEIEFVNKGRGDFAYVSHPACTRRLIEVFGGDWSFEVVETRVESDQCAVLGRLTCSGAVRMAWGGAAMRGDLDDALKAAGSYALKKAASLFGVGLHLWEEPITKEANARALRAEQQPERREEPRAAEPQQTSGGGQQQAQQALGPKPVTERQLNAILAISRSLGWASETVRQHAIDGWGVPPNQLTMKQASELIGDLQGIATKAAS